MRRRNGLALATATATAAALVLGGNAQAFAAPAASCASEIVDGAGVLSADDVGLLTQGSAPLAATTTLRLRTVTSVPNKDLNAYEKQLQISCGWADAANVRQPKLLVVMVDTQDRQVGIYPGPALSGTISKPIWLSIEQHNMRPRLASADWEAGLQGGVSALAALINGAPLAASSAPVVTATSSTHAHKTDYAQFGLFGGAMVLWAVVGLVGRSRKRRRWKQSSAYLYDNISYGDAHHHGGWGWGGGGGGGGSDGGGGSSSDGGGGSSGF